MTDLDKLERAAGIEVPILVREMVTPLVDLAHRNHSRALTEQVIRLAIQVGYYAAERERKRQEDMDATPLAPGLTYGDLRRRTDL